ncbi:MAG: hydrogenase 4 subunit B [Alphaproteobacteria bacterium]|nr:hydrogenase 4 subunit B [Alphaproteobacteria bacterium]
MPFTLFSLAITLYVAGALASLMLPERASSRAAGVIGTVAAVVGFAAALPVLLTGEPVVAAADGPFPFAHFVLRLDRLSAFMVLTITLVGAAVAIYGTAYVREEYAGRGAGAMGFLTNLFIASMLLVVVADNALWFIVFFEAMSLTSYFLVVFEQDDEAVRAGWLYFVIAHAGTLLVLIGFLLLYGRTGSFDFASFRGAAVPAPLASIIFLLAFFGFGAKAGMVPLHIWLPRAHPAAPSHVSALLSGVMIKIGIFGIVRVGVDLLGATTVWWGVLVLVFGSASAVLGVIYALAENDIKRLLAYSSVENVGIVLIGMGIGMIGIAANRPVLPVLGFVAGFYHLLNDAVFKSLLFLGAGSVVSRVRSKDMGHMGGLLHVMPWTALAFLIGALGICAVPPFNGFVSEWFTYQSLFRAALHGTSLLRLLAPLSMAMLGIASALAVMAFVKVIGVTFSGAARTAAAASATEVSWPMLSGMGFLAACCITLGVGAPVVAPLMRDVAASLTGHGVAVAAGLDIFPGDASVGLLSTPLMALLLMGLAAVPLVIVGLYARRRPRPYVGAEVWACGYAPDAGMRVSAGGFAEPIKVLFRPLYGVRNWAEDCFTALMPWFAGLPASAGRTELLWDRWLLAPLGDSVEAVSVRMQVLQGGDFRVYCLYIIAALIALLIVAIG